MPHRPEVRRFAPQVRSVFHFCYAFLHLSCITKYLSPFFCTFLALQTSFLRRKKDGFVKKLSSKNRALLLCNLHHNQFHHRKVVRHFESVWHFLFQIKHQLSRFAIDDKTFRPVNVVDIYQSVWHFFYFK